jgi:hypothetical protein
MLGFQWSWRGCIADEGSVAGESGVAGVAPGLSSSQNSANQLSLGGDVDSVSEGTGSFILPPEGEKCEPTKQEDPPKDWDGVSSRSRLLSMHGPRRRRGPDGKSRPSSEMDTRPSFWIAPRPSSWGDPPSS